MRVKRKKPFVVEGVIQVGTRGSALALTQTGMVIRQLKKRFPTIRFRTIVIQTTGDKIKNTPLSRIGSKGLFIKEIEESLLAKKIDLAVHSMKDLPTELPKGLHIGAVLKRENPHDCLVSLKNHAIETLPQGSKVGTSSLRRQSQILALRPDLKIENLRGNLDTRLKKLKTGLYDAIIVAAAGLERLKRKLSLAGLKFYEIPYSQMLPAVGQGALALETRENDTATNAILKRVTGKNERFCTDCEREFLRVLQGGCQVPIAAIAEVRGKKISLEGLIASIDGKRIIRKKISGAVQNFLKIGSALANELVQAGGKKILEEIRR